MAKDALAPAYVTAISHKRPLYLEGAQELLHFWALVQPGMIQQAEAYDPLSGTARVVARAVDHQPACTFLQQLHADGRLGTADAILNLCSGMPLFGFHFAYRKADDNNRPEFTLSMYWGP